jgi:hypothetical protein
MEVTLLSFRPSTNNFFQFMTEKTFFWEFGQVCDQVCTVGEVVELLKAAENSCSGLNFTQLVG